MKPGSRVKSSQVLPVLVASMLFFGCLCFGAAAQTSESSFTNARRVMQKIVPNYPQMARKMGLSGTVKVVARVAPDGTVKSVEAVGGSPLLVQATEDALMKWKFAPAAAESKELIEIHFNP
jgi:TonB family protein